MGTGKGAVLGGSPWGASRVVAVKVLSPFTDELQDDINL